MKHFLSLLIFLSTASFLKSQNNKYFDAPFGGGGGFVAGWHIPNVGPLNSKLQEIGIPELPTSGMFTTGGAGFIYIGFIKNLRLGGLGYGGSMSKSQSANGINKETVFSMGGGGLTVEYTLPFIKDIGVSLGAVLGAGSMSIELYRNDGNFSWEGVFTEVNSGSTTNISRKLENNYWMFTPSINLEIPVYRFVALKFGTGYKLTFGGDWETENGQTIKNVPADLKSDGLFFELGIFAGFFAF